MQWVLEVLRVSRIFASGVAVEFERVLEAAEADRLISGYQVKAVPTASSA